MSGTEEFGFFFIITPFVTFTMFGIGYVIENFGANWILVAIISILFGVIVTQYDKRN